MTKIFSISAVRLEPAIRQKKEFSGGLGGSYHGEQI
jgi:hypothetical protein